MLLEFIRWKPLKYVFIIFVKDGIQWHISAALVKTSSSLMKNGFYEVTYIKG